jgi:hypothetical protein
MSSMHTAGKAEGQKTQRSCCTPLTKCVRPSLVLQHLQQQKQQCVSKAAGAHVVFWSVQQHSLQNLLGRAPGCDAVTGSGA